VQVLFGGHQQGLPMVGIHANASQLEVGFFQKMCGWKFFQANPEATFVVSKKNLSRDNWVYP